MLRTLGLAAAIIAVFASGTASGSPVSVASGKKLHASVDDDFTITLTDDSGARVTKLDPGTYEIEVEDETGAHNFHLFGPGVDRATSVSGEGKDLWTVTFKDGMYTYICDAHPSSMKASFTVGNPAQAPPAGGTAITAKTGLVLTSGPGFTITFKTSAGKIVKSMKRGLYTVRVRDLSRIHNAHIAAPGYNRATKPLEYTGIQTWKVKLAKTGTLRFLCDPHAGSMKGSARITR